MSENDNIVNNRLCQAFHVSLPTSSFHFLKSAMSHTKQLRNKRNLAGDKKHRELALARYGKSAELRWTGILADLETFHGIETPDRILLVTIAQTLAHLLPDSEFGREEKRRKNLTIGWLNYHYDQIRDYIPNLVITTKTGEALGPQAAEFTRWTSQHPDHPIVQYLNE
jgi:hypothetical protein